MASSDHDGQYSPGLDQRSKDPLTLSSSRFQKRKSLDGNVPGWDAK